MKPIRKASHRMAGLVLGALLGGIVIIVPNAQASKPATDDRLTTTPIKHVMLILGENRTFDSVFGTFRPRPGQQVKNLLSEGIVTVKGTPGPHFAKARQWMAQDTTTYAIHPGKIRPYTTLGPITTTGTPDHAPFQRMSIARSVEPGLPADAYKLLTTGGSGLMAGASIDPRFPSTLPGGPFNITRYVPFDSYTGSPTHRFFQMWQQTDCNMTVATPDNPSGCRNDLWLWVESTVGNGSNGKPESPDHAQPGRHQGAVAMGYYNMAKGDVAYFNHLAHRYALGDNFHQSVMGGTGANHVEIGFGTAIYYANAKGQPATPPMNQIENPNPQPGTNNFYSQDGYHGGSYVECDDATRPGVGAIDAYLHALPYAPFHGGDCRPGAFYLVNNYNPGYLGNGKPAALGPDRFTVPPTTQQNLGLLLSRHGISWHYYGEGWHHGTEAGEHSTYCNICNPFLYSKQIMTQPSLRANLKGIRALYKDIRGGTLPAVSIVKPDAFLDGHPASSKLDLFEGFCRKIIRMVKANPALWHHTAIIITFDEGGGYYDSGYIQPIDFFGDGTRIPLIVVSPYARGVGVVHTYGDQVSFDKFVESNWKLGPISSWSRDNLPNPVSHPGDPYVPINSPAISNLMGMFDFHTHDR